MPTDTPGGITVVTATHDQRSVSLPQAANWIPVPMWRGDPGDEELLRLIPLLGQLSRAVRSREGAAGVGGGASALSSWGRVMWAAPDPSPLVQDDVRAEIRRRFPDRRLPTED